MKSERFNKYPYFNIYQYEYNNCSFVDLQIHIITTISLYVY